MLGEAVGLVLSGLGSAGVRLYLASEKEPHFLWESIRRRLSGRPHRSLDFCLTVRAVFQCEIFGNEKGCLMLNSSTVVGSIIVLSTFTPTSIYHHRYELSSCYLIILCWQLLLGRSLLAYSLLTTHRDEGLPLIGTIWMTIPTNNKAQLDFGLLFHTHYLSVRPYRQYRQELHHRNVFIS
jgi:hypothetical protein